MTNQKIDNTLYPVALAQSTPNGWHNLYAFTHFAAWNRSNLKGVIPFINPKRTVELPKSYEKAHFSVPYMQKMQVSLPHNLVFHSTPAFLAVNHYRMKFHAKAATTRTTFWDRGDIYRYAWNVLNMGVVTGTTAAAILIVQSPIKTVLIHQIKSGKFLPDYKGNKLALLQSLYVGTSSAFSGLAAKSLYVTHVKAYKPRPEEELKLKAAYVAAAGAGYTLVNNGPCNFSDLQKGFIISQDFNWRTWGNIRRLVSGGFSIKYAIAMLNMGALCGLETHIASVLAIKNQELRFTLAGALSGAAAAVATYPLSVLKDYSLLQTVVVNGRLRNISTYEVTRGVMNRFTNNPTESIRTFMLTAKKQMPVRLAGSSVVFAMISGVANVLGVEPLRAVVPEQYQPSSGKPRFGFFSGSPLNIQIESLSRPKNSAP